MPNGQQPPNTIGHIIVERDRDMRAPIRRDEVEPGVTKVRHLVHVQGLERAKAIFSEIEHLVVRSCVERRQSVPSPPLESAAEQFGLPNRRLWLDRREATHDEQGVVRNRSAPNPRSAVVVFARHSATVPCEDALAAGPKHMAAAMCRHGTVDPTNTMALTNACSTSIGE